MVLGVCAEGLVVYEDEEETESFSWATVVNMSFKHSNFLARILQSEVDKHVYPTPNMLAKDGKASAIPKNRHYFFTYRLGKYNIPG